MKHEELRVVLNCAGRGKRLDLSIPKVLIPIGGRSLLHWHLLNFADVSDLCIVVGYKAEVVIKEVETVRPDARIVHNTEFQITKPGTSFYMGAKGANGLVIGWNGDIFANPADVRRCIEAKHEFAAYSSILSSEPVYVQTEPSGSITGFGSKGIYEWTGPLCLHGNKIVDVRGNMRDLLKRYLPVNGMLIQAIDIDTQDDYLLAQTLAAKWENTEL